MATSLRDGTLKTLVLMLLLACISGLTWQGAALAAESGRGGASSDSPEQLADAYLTGRGVEIDYDLAFHWASIGAEQGSAKCYFYLGQLYMYGNGVEQDGAIALEWLEKASAQGQFKANRYAGLIYLDGTVNVEPDSDKAFSLFLTAAGDGDITSQYYVGYCYENGVGIEQDYAKAAEYYEKAAGAGKVVTMTMESMTALGRLYENGLGVDQNVETAIEWYAKAAELGDTDAIEALSKLQS